MPLKLTGRHMTISDTTRDYIDKKVDRLRRLVPKIDDMSFTMSKEKLLVDVEANFAAGKIRANARVQAEHLLEAIDILVDKLESQISKAKKKYTDKSKAAKQSMRVDEQALSPSPEEQAELEAEIAEEIEEDLAERQVAEG